MRTLHSPIHTQTFTVHVMQMVVSYIAATCTKSQYSLHVAHRALHERGFLCLTAVCACVNDMTDKRRKGKLLWTHYRK